MELTAVIFCTAGHVLSCFFVNLDLPEGSPFRVHRVFEIVWLAVVSCRRNTPTDVPIFHVVVGSAKFQGS